MPELLIPIIVFYFIYLYFTMKKPTTPTEKPVPKSKIEQPVATIASEAKAANVNPTQKPPNKPKTVTPKPVPKAETEQPAAVVTTEAKTIKPSQPPKSPKKALTVASKPVEEKPEMSLPERVGLTAGSIWHYLSEMGLPQLLNWFWIFQKKKRLSNAASAGWPRRAKLLSTPLIRLRPSA
jgi:hypothetical protein